VSEDPGVRKMVARTRIGAARQGEAEEDKAGVGECSCGCEWWQRRRCGNQALRKVTVTADRVVVEMEVSRRWGVSE